MRRLVKTSDDINDLVVSGLISDSRPPELKGDTLMFSLAGGPRLPSLPCIVTGPGAPGLSGILKPGERVAVAGTLVATDSNHVQANVSVLDFITGAAPDAYERDEIECDDWLGEIEIDAPTYGIYPNIDEREDPWGPER